MGMTGFNMWREKEARKKAEENHVTAEETAVAQEEDVTAEETAVAPKKGKKPTEK